MPDLLTHALIGYSMAVILSRRYEWLSDPFISVVILGTLLPDVSKSRLVIPEHIVEDIIGVPFGWGAFHTAGGVAICVLIGSLLAAPEVRSRVLAALSLGALTHLVTDALLFTPTGYAGKPYFWPISSYRPPSPGLYLSTDVWPAVVMLAMVLSLRFYFRNHPE